MPLVIGFLCGEYVTIGSTFCSVEFDPPRLERLGHPPTPVTDSPHCALPGVCVTMAPRQSPPYLRVAFEAPRDIAIIRGVRADVL